MRKTLLGMMVGLVCLSGTAIADTLPITADGWTRGWGGDVNGYHTNFIGSMDGGWEMKAVMKFDLSGLTDNVDSATLHLYINNKQYSPSDVYFTRISPGNDVNAVQFNIDHYSGDWSSPALACSSSTPMDTWVTIDLASMINSARNEGATHLAVRFIENPFTAQSYNEVFGFVGTAGDANYAPYLEYTLVPEPATLSLLAVGGLGVLRRRKR